MKHFLLPEELVNKLLAYINTRPYGEVSDLVNSFLKDARQVTVTEQQAAEAEAQASAPEVSNGAGTQEQTANA